jgi:quercetin dioxygenase-like cupin family protein
LYSGAVKAFERKECALAELKIGRAKEIPAREVTTEGAEHVTIRWLVSKKDGAPGFQMRLFEVGPGGRTPLHTHEWEHEVYILEGTGTLIFEGEEQPFRKGFFAFVPAGRIHSFVNTGKGKLTFLCIVPV